jgi:hypothetical protein
MQGHREYFLYAGVYIQIYSPSLLILREGNLNILRHKWSDFFRIFFTDLNMILLHRFEYNGSQWNAAVPKTEHFILFRIPATPPPPRSAKDVSCLLQQRNNVELQRKNSRRNIAFSVSSILPMKSSIYKDHKSFSLQQESKNL